MCQKTTKTPPPTIDRFRGPYDFLSNFYPAKLRYEGLTYCNAEAAYQAQKGKEDAVRPSFSRLYGDEAKRRARQIPLREDWEERKVAVMEGVLAAKFSQNPHLAQWLMETGEALLREGNPWGDRFWGVDQKTGAGENRLGQLLMALRDRYRREGVPPAPPCPEQRFQASDGLILTDRESAWLPAACIVHGEDASCRDTVFRAAGPALREARQKLGRWEIGQARLTPGYGLRAAYVLHVIEPVYGRDPEALLAQCYAACLDLAQAHRFPEIVFPPLATGKACFPKAKAARIAVESVRRWRKTHRGPVVLFSCADQRSFDCVRAALEEGAP